MRLNVNLYLSWCFELKFLGCLLFLNLSHSKMPTLLTLSITGKLELIVSLLAFLGILQTH